MKYYKINTIYKDALNHLPIFNYKPIKELMNELDESLDKDNSNFHKKYMCLLKDNEKEMIKLFGNNNDEFKGEFKYKIWSLKVGNGILFILTNYEKGTCYEYNGDVISNQKEIKNIIKYLFDYICKDIEKSVNTDSTKIIKSKNIFKKE